MWFIDSSVVAYYLWTTLAVDIVALISWYNLNKANKSAVRLKFVIVSCWYYHMNIMTNDYMEDKPQYDRVRYNDNGKYY